MKNTSLFITVATTALLIVTCACCTTKETHNTMKDKSDIYKILHYASLAGSSHNSQPWRADVYHNDSILVFADTSRLLNVVDPKGTEMYISVGAFIGNLVMAARALGYDTKISLSETGINPLLPVASIKLTKNGLPANTELLEEIELRTTLRIPFDTLTVKNNHLKKLVSLAPEYIAFFSYNSPEGRFISQKELEAFTIQAYQKEAQDELASWMRFSDKDVNSKRDGLTPAGMGIKGIGGFVVRNFMKPEDSKKESFVKSGVEKTQKQVENCGGWIFITSEKEDVNEWINTGRVYEQLNIICRSMNLGFHPMNQLIEVPQIYQEVTETLALNKKIIFAARIGYVNEYPAPVSKRRPVESFTTFK